MVIDVCVTVYVSSTQVYHELPANAHQYESLEQVLQAFLKCIA